MIIVPLWLFLLLQVLQEEFIYQDHVFIFSSDFIIFSLKPK